MEQIDQQSKYKNCILDIKQYQVLKEIQSGTFGSVSSVQNLETKTIYAAKVFFQQNDEYFYKKMINREIEIMIKCNHPTIIKIIGFSYKDFNDNENLTIIMEYSKNGSLLKLLENLREKTFPGKYNNTNRQIILIGIARGMMYLHENNIIHRDLKPGNVLLDDDLHPLITDFGLSKIYDKGHSMYQSQYPGTPAYMAPEVIEGESYNGKADVYSFGILMYEVVTELIPYPLLYSGKLNNYKFNQKVINENYRPQFPQNIKTSIKKLITKCWSRDQFERPTFGEIFKKLAYGIDDSIDDIFELEYGIKDDSKNKYFIDDDVDADAIRSYAKSIDDTLLKAENKEKMKKEKIKKVVNEEIEPLKMESNEMKSQVKKMQELQEAIKKTINFVKNENIEIKKDNQQIKIRNNDLDEMIKDKTNLLLKEDEEMKSEMKNFKKEISKNTDLLLKENEDMKSEMKNFKDEISKNTDLLTKENEDMKSEMKNFKNDISKNTDLLLKENEDMKSEMKNFKDDILNNINLLTKENEEMKSEMKNLKSEISKNADLLLKENEDMKSEMKNFKNDILNNIDLLTKENEDMKSEMKNFKNDILNNIDLLTKENEKMKIQNGDLLNRLIAAENNIIEVKKQTSIVYEELMNELRCIKYEFNKLKERPIPEASALDPVLVSSIEQNAPVDLSPIENDLRNVIPASVEIRAFETPVNNNADIESLKNTISELEKDNKSKQNNINGKQQRIKEPEKDSEIKQNGINSKQQEINELEKSNEYQVEILESMNKKLEVEDNEPEEQSEEQQKEQSEETEINQFLDENPIFIKQTNKSSAWSNITSNLGPSGKKKDTQPTPRSFKSTHKPKLPSNKRKKASIPTIEDEFYDEETFITNFFKK